MDRHLPLAVRSSRDTKTLRNQKIVITSAARDLLFGGGGMMLAAEPALEQRLLSASIHSRLLYLEMLVRQMRGHAPSRRAIEETDLH